MQSTESVRPNIPEDIWFITILSPSNFIDKIFESRYYLNSTIQVQFCKYNFRQFIFKICCDDMTNNFDIIEDNFSSHYQSVSILKQLQFFRERCTLVGNNNRNRSILQSEILGYMNKWMPYNLKDSLYVLGLREKFYHDPGTGFLFYLNF